MNAQKQPALWPVVSLGNFAACFELTPLYRLASGVFFVKSSLHFGLISVYRGTGGRNEARAQLKNISGSDNPLLLSFATNLSHNFTPDGFMPESDYFVVDDTADQASKKLEEILRNALPVPESIVDPETLPIPAFDTRPHVPSRERWSVLPLETKLNTIAKWRKSNLPGQEPIAYVLVETLKEFRAFLIHGKPLRDLQKLIQNMNVESRNNDKKLDRRPTIHRW